MIVYLIGSLRNPDVPRVAELIRSWGHDCIDDWYAAGPEADDKWQEYETRRGRSYGQALDGLHAAHVFDFDSFHIGRADAGVLLHPAGRSCHIEFGVIRGMKKPGYIVLGEHYDRFDVMYRYATKVVAKPEELEGLLC